MFQFFLILALSSLILAIFSNSLFLWMLGRKKATNEPSNVKSDFFSARLLGFVIFWMIILFAIFEKTAFVRGS